MALFLRFLLLCFLAPSFRLTWESCTPFSFRFIITVCHSSPLETAQHWAASLCLSSGATGHWTLGIHLFWFCASGSWPVGCWNKKMAQTYLGSNPNTMPFLYIKQTVLKGMQRNKFFHLDPHPPFPGTTSVIRVLCVFAKIFCECASFGSSRCCLLFLMSKKINY